MGGLLVALAAVGIFAGYLSATAGHARPTVVATTDLGPGHRLTAADLAVVRLELPGSVAERTYVSPSQLVGAVVLGPVGRGELLQSSDVLAGDAPGGPGREISFAIDAARAVDGRLRPGEPVDVLATFGTGADATTTVVATAVRIARRSDPGGGLAGPGTQVVTLTMPDEATTIAVANAVDTATVTLVRSAGREAGGTAGGTGPTGAEPSAPPSAPRDAPVAVPGPEPAPDPDAPGPAPGP